MPTRLADNPLLKKTQSGDFGVLSIMVDAIQPSPYQTRRCFEEAGIEELAQSIRHIGLVQPIKVVREGESFRLVYGERRLRAIRKLGIGQLLWDSRSRLATLPTDSAPAATSNEALQTLTENILRDDLSPIEEAEAYLNILRTNQLESQQQVAEVLGIDKRRVSEKIALLRLPDAIKEQMPVHPEFTFRHARALLRLTEEAAQLELFQRILAEDLSVLQTERLVEERLQGLAPPRRVPRPPPNSRARLLRRFRRAAWQLLDATRAIAAADDATRREWQRRFGGPDGLVAQLRTGLEGCQTGANSGRPEVLAANRPPTDSAAADEMRPAE